MVSLIYSLSLKFHSRENETIGSLIEKWNLIRWNSTNQFLNSRLMPQHNSPRNQVNYELFFLWLKICSIQISLSLYQGFDSSLLIHSRLIYVHLIVHLGNTFLGQKIAFLGSDKIQYSQRSFDLGGPFFILLIRLLSQFQGIPVLF